MTNDSSRQPADEAAARQAIELNPQAALAYYHLGRLLAQQPDRVHEAEAVYRRASELEPTDARFIYRLGLLLHERLQRFTEAEAAYRQAIALAPEEPFVYGGLVSLLVQQARHPEALALGAKMRALLTAREQWYGLATLDALLGHTEAALEALRQAARSANFDRDWARTDPDLASLHGHPSFEDIIGKSESNSGWARG